MTDTTTNGHEKHKRTGTTDTDSDTRRWRTRCEECGIEGAEDDHDAAKTLTRWHNEDHHDGEHVAEVEEVDA